jgi:hypothetical protein
VSRTKTHLVVVAFGAIALSQAHAASLCYSSDPPPARYQIQDSDVIDTQTGLTWRRCSVGQRWTDSLGCVGVVQQLTWNEARKHEKNGWRLPDKAELSSLVELTCGLPAIDERAFPDIELTKLWYWTNTREDALVWYVAFGGGSQRQASPTTWNAVRLVRKTR